MATATGTKVQPAIMTLIGAFSDYGTKVSTTYRDALDKYAAYHVELSAHLDGVRKDLTAAGTTDHSAKVIGAKLRDMAKTAGKVWAMADEDLSTVLFFGKWHTEVLLAKYVGDMLTEGRIPMPSGYRGYLGEVSRKERDAKGVTTDYGTKAAKARATNAAKLAATKSARGGDYLSDAGDDDTPMLDKYKQLLMMRADLEVDIAAAEKALKVVKGKPVPKAVSAVRSAVTKARKDQAGLVSMPTRPS